MNRHLYLVFLILLPLMLFSHSANDNRFEDNSNPLITQLNHMKIAENLPGHRLPYITVNRDRSWQLREIYQEIDTDYNNTLDPWARDSIFYHDDTSSKIDSLLAYRWDTISSEFELERRVVYTYEPNGLYVSEIEYTNVGDLHPFAKLTISYNSQHRMIAYRYYGYITDTSEYVLYYRQNYLYGVDRVNQIITLMHFDTIQYEKQVFTHDAMGRILTNTITTSVDSLNWDNYQYIETTYNANDTSTGEDYIQYMYQSVINNNMYSTSHPIMYGVNTSYSNWTGTGWATMFRILYSYNALNNLTQMTYQGYDNVWYESSREVYTYDTNNNAYQIYWQIWITIDSEWGDPTSRRTFTWEQAASIEDDNIAPAVLNLSGYPNPFASGVNITLQSKSNAPVQVNVYNLKGQLIKTLSGSKTLTWDGTDTKNQSVSNGIYFIQAEQDGRAVSGKVIRIK